MQTFLIKDQLKNDLILLKKNSLRDNEKEFGRRFQMLAFLQ